MKKISRLQTVFSALVLAVLSLGLVGSASALTPPVVFTNSDNNMGVNVTAGQPFSLKLTSNFVIPEGHPGSTITPTTTAVLSTFFWENYTSSNQAAVQLTGNWVPTYVPAAPGRLTLTSTQNFTALAPGNTTLVARSISYYVCGHSVFCPGIKYGNYYRLYVHVLPACGGPIQHVAGVKPSQTCTSQ